jgi:hypothetical protein
MNENKHIIVNRRRSGLPLYIDLSMRINELGWCLLGAHFGADLR